MAFSGSTPFGGSGSTSGGGLQQARGFFGKAPPSFSTGASGANGNAAPSNPFTAFQKLSQTTTDMPTPAPFNPFAAKAAAQPAAAPTPSIFARGSSPAAANPFQAAMAKPQATPAAASPFGSFGVPSQGQGVASAPTSNPFANAGQKPAAQPLPSCASSSNGPTAAPAPNPFPQAARNHGSIPSTTKKATGGFGADARPATTFGSAPTPQNQFASTEAAPLPLSKAQGQAKANTSSGPPSDYAKRIVNQLQKDNIKPPQWPSEPGNPSNRMAMETYRESYKKYRDQARASLIKAGLIDDPEVRKRLDEAIDFKGICEDMCPEFEKISRIVQYDVKMPEKTKGLDGTMWASPPLMVKALARSAAGQEAPLPMDVRSVASLKRTLDYLIDTTLGDDSRLPTMHNFLWDRTRAIRRDFVFHSTMSDDEMREQVYCLENITRFHTVALHLLSQKGFAAEDFSEQQEIEQLGKALLSLMQAYNDCRDKGIVCRNEAEFRAYFILLNAHDPDFQSKVSEWGAELWDDSDDIQTALTLVQAMQSVWDWRGPLKPHVPTATALGAFTTYFRIVESPQVSYMMACVAEIFFVHVRRGILRNTVRAYARIRDSPKDLTVAALNAMLRFDTDEEARDFITQHNLEFSSDNLAEAHLLLDKTVHIGNPTIRQSFSQKLVERKRSGRPLPEAIHSTLFEKEEPAVLPSSAASAALTTISSGSSLFVDPTPSAKPPVATTTNCSTAFAKHTAAATATNPFSSYSSSSSSSSPFSFPTARQTDAAPTVPSSTLFATATDSNNNSKKRNVAPGEANHDAGRQSFAAVFQKVNSQEQGRSKPGEAKPPSTTATPANALFGSSSSSTKSPFNPFQQTPAVAPVSKPAESTKPASFFTSNTTPKPMFGSAFSTSAPKTDEPLAAPSPSPFAPAAAKEPAPRTTAAPSNAVSTSQPLFGSGPNKSSQEVEKAAAPSLFSKPAAATTTAGPNCLFREASTPKPSSFQQPSAAAPAPPPTKADLMGDFNRWVVLGDNGILDDFKTAFVEHILQRAVAQLQREEDERVRRKEDERSWAEARRFQTYNLSVKYFYRWRNLARERALDRRARQARDDMRAYRSAKRAKQRAAAEKAAEKAAAEAHEREVEMRRMNSREVQFLEELGYYGTFGASSRKRKASGAGSDTGREGPEDPADADMAVDEDAAKPEQQQQRLPMRQSIKDGFASTVARTKELLTRGRSSSMDNGRASYGSMQGAMDGRDSLDNGSISGDSVRSGTSMRNIGSLNSMGDKMVAYYRRSVPGKTRTSSIYTRVPVPPAQTATTAAVPRKTTNFMRYRSSSIGHHHIPNGNGNGNGGSSHQRSPSLAGSVGRSTSPALSHLSASVVNGGGGGYQSNVRSSYWRLRALGLVQMPNKQYLHESLALPMLQDGKRFRGVGNYGLPPVPTWDEASKEQKEEEEEEEKEEEEPLSRKETYAEERMRRSLAAASARKRVFSGGHEAARVHGAGDDSEGANTGSKKPKVRPSLVEGTTGEVDETERVIREMREMADAMDQDKDWFREQTEQLKKGNSIWGQ